MQRNSRYLHTLIDILLLCGVFLYLILTTIYRGLPPLVGFVFAAVVVLKFEHDNKFKNYGFAYFFGFCYLFCAEQIHGFKLFSIFITYVVFYFFIFEISMKFIKFRSFLPAFYVIIGYTGIVGVSNLISYILKDEYMPWDTKYFYYIFVEILMATMIFKGRIL